MGSDVCEVEESPTHTSSIKVHLDMCTLLLKLVNRISSIFPDIDAARPRCLLGLEALCRLQREMEKAKILVQICSKSSKLYLAFRGHAVVLRFEGTRDILQQSLSQLKNMVPVVLRLRISEILCDLRDAVFSMDSHEEEAGKALKVLVRKLQQQDAIDSVEDSEMELLQFAVLRLHFSSLKELSVERRSIKKLLNEVKKENSAKRETLEILLYLLRHYDKLIVQGQTSIPSSENDTPCLLVKFDCKSATTNSTNLESGPVNGGDLYQASVIHTHIPPEEFICPLSSSLMCDPVIISSGQTFERTSIQKWFHKGHDTCPKTKLKLVDLTLTPNTSLRYLILRWSMEQGDSVSDPRIESTAFAFSETSSFSFCSSMTSMKDLFLPIDMSNIALGSHFSDYSSDFSHSKVEKDLTSLQGASDIDFQKNQISCCIQKIGSQFLSDIDELPWESQCRAVQDYLIDFNPSSFLSENLLEALVRFLKNALDRQDAEAQKAGSQLFLTYLRMNRREAAPLCEDAYKVFASFLGTETSAETIAIMEILSAQESNFPNFAASGALTSIIKFVDSGQNTEFNEAVIRILHNLSVQVDTCSCKLTLDWVPILVRYLGDCSVSGTCLSILEKLSKFEEVRISIAETDGCIESIVQLLETGSCKDQEHAVGILFSLCDQHEHYCHMVLYEGAVPYLNHVSVSGNEQGKDVALKLLRLLRGIRIEDNHLRSNGDAFDGYPMTSVGQQCSKKSSSLGMKVKLFFRKN